MDKQTVPYTEEATQERFGNPTVNAWFERLRFGGEPCPEIDPKDCRFFYGIGENQVDLPIIVDTCEQSS